jgi:hypothetical protein
VIATTLGASPGDAMHRLRALIESLLPWYDPERDAEKDRHVAATVRRADQLSERIRSEFRPADARLARRGR